MIIQAELFVRSCGRGEVHHKGKETFCRTKKSIFSKIREGIEDLLFALNRLC